MSSTPIDNEQSSGIIISAQTHDVGVDAPMSKRRRLLQVLLLATVVAMLIAGYSNHWLSSSGVPISPSRREYLTDFQFSRLGGGHWRLSDHRGQVILLNFWATWCPPCREETPGLVRLAQQVGSNDVAIVGISMDEDHGAIPGFVRAFHIQYPILLPQLNSPLPGSVESLPTSLLLDCKGRVARSYVGAVSEDVFTRDVQQLLQEARRQPASNS